MVKVVAGAMFVVKVVDIVVVVVVDIVVVVVMVVVVVVVDEVNEVVEVEVVSNSNFKSSKLMTCCKLLLLSTKRFRSSLSNPILRS